MVSAAKAPCSSFRTVSRPLRYGHSLRGRSERFDRSQQILRGNPAGNLQLMVEKADFSSGFSESSSPLPGTRIYIFFNSLHTFSNVIFSILATAVDRC